MGSALQRSGESERHAVCGGGGRQRRRGGDGNLVQRNRVGFLHRQVCGGRNGALLWERPYNGLGNGNDYGKAVAVDSSGNVVVTGSSCYDSNGDIEYYTAKYAAADGALLWEKHYNNSSGYAAAIDLALDSRGNVVVTGTTFENGGWYTAKYAAADGALLWEQRYSTPVDWVAYARSVALDSSGNVVVTGYSRLSAGGGLYCSTQRNTRLPTVRCFGKTWAMPLME